MFFLFDIKKERDFNMGSWKHSGSLNIEMSNREIENAKFARKAAGEGIVLLKNEGVLPLKENIKISLLGIGAKKTIKGGIGSGDVNNRESISIYQGLKSAGAVIVSEGWLEDYENRYKAAREVWKERILEEAKHVDNPFDAYAENPFLLPEGRKIGEKEIEGADVVVYVVSRISGEGKDRRKVKGDYYLSEREGEDLTYLNQKEIPVVLILNAGGPVEITDILENTENIKTVLNISQPGQEGGNAVADILYGKVTPSGKLTTTWARRYEDYPCADTFSYLNGNLDVEEYKEGIYVGYRYFDTYGVKPLFSFGYGLSYTEFETKFDSIKTEKNEIVVAVTVKNIGTEYSGKEVVQLYISLPQNEIEKERRRLIGYQKTKELKPGETQNLEIKVEQKAFASFAEKKHVWMIEEGNYGIWIGNCLDTAKLSAQIKIESDVELEETEKLEFQSDLIENQYKRQMVQEDKQFSTCIFVPKKEKSIACRDVLEEKYEVEELIPLLYGNISETTSTLGAAGIKVPGTAGETTEALFDKYKIPSLIMADGPAGIRLQQCYEVDRKTDTVYGIGVLGALENGFLVKQEKHENTDTYYQFCTAFPVGTVLAQAWNVELMEEFGKKIADEMEEFHIQLWLAPGLNIHRNPLCGRNFEYYSEDPILAGTLTAAVTKGVQSKKSCGVTIKHFACNNQEDNRMGVDVHISERALREIYLRGFEIAVKNSNPVAMMSSYNLVNGVHAANSKDLCTKIAREEWGFEGVIMSDWNTTVPEDGSIPWKCVAAGNDIIMPGNMDDDKNIREAYHLGKISEEEIRKSAGRILKMIEKLV